MDIEKILELYYREYKWSIVNNDYNRLDWSNENSVNKPSYEELYTLYQSEEFKDKEKSNKAIETRQEKILEAWPMEKQFEALTEHAMGKSEKLNELIDYIGKLKKDHPKP